MYNPPGYVWVTIFAGPVAFIVMACAVLYGGALRAGLPWWKATLVAAGMAIVPGGWLGISAVMAGHGWYDSTSGFPLLPVATLGALSVFIALSQVPAVRRSVAAPGMLSRLILPQTVRVTGAAPLMYLVLGHLPALFAVPAALGDITTGIAAPFVARRLARGAGPRVAVWFNAFGITDLVVSAILGALTGYHLIKVTPAADLSQLPIALVPTAVVPMLLALHVISLRALAGAANTAQPPSPQLAPPSSGTADRHALRHRIQDRQSTPHGNYGGNGADRSGSRTVTIAKPSGQALFRHRDFVLLWGGQTVSQTGTQVTILALPLVAIVALKATTFQVALLSVADTSAYLLVALPAGVLADSMRRRPLMLSSCIALMVVVGSVPVAQVAGILSLAQLYVVALVSSVLSVLFTVAYTSYLPALVKRDQLIDANGKLRTSQSFAELAGPSLGALLVGVFGSVQAIVGDALSYAFSSACLLLIQSREPRVTPAGDRKRAGFCAQLGEAITYVLHDPVLRKTVAWSGTANFFVIMVETLGPVYLIRSVHLRPAYVGLLLAVGAAGGVTAGSMSGFLARRIGSARITWLSMTVFTVPGLLIPVARPGWWALLFAIGWMSWTFGSTLCGVAVTTYQQATCPPELRGRVSGTARWVTWGTLPLGGLAAGSLGSALGAHATLWIAAIGGCLSGLWLYFSPLRHMRDMPIEKFQPASSPT